MVRPCEAGRCCCQDSAAGFFCEAEKLAVLVEADLADRPDGRGV